MNKETFDKFGRRLKYLRISVTDRCNFRCKYCMPNNDFEMVECSDILRYEDILFASEVFASLGVNRIRITGGEPLVRKGICQFLDKLTKIENISEVMLTTNGSLLEKYAADLYNAGVKRLNISLDSLIPERNKYITGVEYNIICRFIEFMPIGNSENWNEKNIVYGSEIIERLKDFEPQEMLKDKNSGPAVNYKLNNGGIIGIITPISKHFCSECDKLRITADGKIRPCLLSDNEIDIKKAIKDKDKEMLIKQIMQSLNIKHNEHNITTGEQNHDFKRTMSKIGG